MNEQMTISGKKKPSSLLDLIPAIDTSGATPDRPMPLTAAATVPAVGAVAVLVVAEQRLRRAASSSRRSGRRRSSARIRMGEVQPGVDVADHHVGAAGGDLVGERGVDLAHVPLQARERLRRRRCCRSRDGVVGLVRLDLAGERRGGRHALDAADRRDLTGEGRVGGAGDDHADLPVAGHHRPARRRDGRRGVGARRTVRVHDEIGLGRPPGVAVPAGMHPPDWSRPPGRPARAGWRRPPRGANGARRHGSLGSPVSPRTPSLPRCPSL